MSHFTSGSQVSHSYKFTFPIPMNFTYQELYFLELNKILVICVAFPQHLKILVNLFQSWGHFESPVECGTLDYLAPNNFGLTTVGEC